MDYLWIWIIYELSLYELSIRGLDNHSRVWSFWSPFTQMGKIGASEPKVDKLIDLLVFPLQGSLTNPEAVSFLMYPHLPLSHPVSHGPSPLSSADPTLHLFLGERRAFFSRFRFRRWGDRGGDSPVPWLGGGYHGKQARTVGQAPSRLFWLRQSMCITHDTPDCFNGDGFTHNINHNSWEQPLEMERDLGKAMTTGSGWSRKRTQVLLAAKLPCFVHVLGRAVTDLALSLTSVALKLAVQKPAASESRGMLLLEQMALSHLWDFAAAHLAPCLGRWRRPFLGGVITCFSDDYKDQPSLGNRGIGGNTYIPAKMEYVGAFLPPSCQIRSASPTGRRFIPDPAGASESCGGTVHSDTAMPEGYAGHTCLPESSLEPIGESLPRAAFVKPSIIP